MALKNVKAIPHPCGNRIDLTWEYDDPAKDHGVAVVRRREGSYPTIPDEGDQVPVGPRPRRDG